MKILSGSHNVRNTSAHIKCVRTDRKQMSVLHSEGLRGRPHIGVSKRKTHKTTASLFTDGGTLVEPKRQWWGLFTKPSRS